MSVVVVAMYPFVANGHGKFEVLFILYLYLYIRKDLKFKLVPEYSIFIDKVIETIFVEIEFNEKKKSLCHLFIDLMAPIQT